MHFKTLAFSLLAIGLIAATAAAGSMNTFLTISARFDNDFDFNPLPLNLNPDGSVANGNPGVYQVDVSFTAAAAAGEKGWANTLFDLGVGTNTAGSNLALSLPVGWTSNSNTLDTNGAASGGVKPIFGTNTDGGTPGDLKAIVASIESATITTTANDTRNNLGTPLAPAGAFNPPDPGTWIGSFYVNWNGIGVGSATVSNQQFSFTTTSNTFGATQQGAGAGALFGFSPPPPVVTPLDLIAPFSGVTLSGTVTATNSPTSWAPALNSLVLQSYTPNYGAIGSVGFIATPSWDPVTQHFSWNTTGAKRGDYTWNVSATNAGGTGNGLITAHLALLDPEPSSIVLAMIGLAGLTAQFVQKSNRPIRV